MTARKSSAKSKPKKQRVAATRFEKMLSPLRLFLVLVLTFGFSSVGRAAEKIRRGFKNKKANLKASYQALLTAKAWGYFRPAWTQGDAREMTPPLEGIEKVMDDPESRIESDFRVRSGLKSRVAFWIDIYARFTSEYRVLHDKDNPELIYGYLDFRPLFRSMPRGMAKSRAHQIEDRVIKELKERIAEAMEVSKPKQPHLTPDEKDKLRQLLAEHGIRSAEDALRPIRRVRAQTGQKDHFLKGIQRSAKLIPQVEEIFKQHSLPVALARLPFVESAYNRNAVSKVGAMGMWQFLPETARRFAPSASWGELSDPLKQSKSAARMFSILRGKFDDWGLAVTSYNSGAVRVKRIADQNNANNVERLIRVPLKKGNLGFAGNNFYCEFLAALYVENYKDRIFSSHEMQVARLDVSRKVQSLLSSQATEDKAPMVELKPVAPVKKAPAKARKLTKKEKRAKLRLVNAHSKKKVRLPKKSIRKMAYRPRPAARRA